MEIFLYGEIGWQVNATEFIQTLKEATATHDTVTIAIDSPGGDAFQGLSIYSAIQEEKAKGKTIIGHVKALAASAASLVAIGCSEVVMNSYAMMMIHKGSLYVRSDSDMELLEKINQTMIELYANKTGLKDKALNELLNKTTWMTASDAVELGFADKIIEVLAPVEALSKMEKVRQLMAINNVEYETVSMLSNSMAPYYIEQKNNETHMFDKINAALGSQFKSQDEVVASIAELVETNKQVSASLVNEQALNTELKARVTALESTIKATVSEKATQLIEAAIKDGRFTETAKASWIEKATTDYDGIKALIESIPVSELKKGNFKLADKVTPKISAPTAPELGGIAAKLNAKAKALSQKNISND